MKAGTIESWAWSKRRWWLMVMLVMGVQVLLIFLLSAPETVARLHVRTQGIFLRADVTGIAEGLSDPTMFVLPSPHGFSGPAWVNGRALEQPSLEWTEPLRWLTQDPARLGNDFCNYVARNATTSFKLSEPSELEIIPAINDFRNDLLPANSAFRVEGELAHRPLVSPLTLPSQVAQDTVLTSSEVSIGVRDDGTVFSAKLIKGCGDKGVDDQAVNLARSARFARLSGTAKRSTDTLSWGTLVFQWLSVAPGTNSPATRP
ncbi:MAG TPA: energy transducer TonB [Verrucomicrobiae bacterium]|nr:energy transducer TonB [Verrucomicrobiae bacterium]